MSPEAKTIAGETHPQKRVRMIDIARLAGVSRQAVSFVLGGDDHSIGAEKAADILRIAKQLRYHPNHAARQLAGKRSGIIAVLVCPAMAQKELRFIGWFIRTARERKFTALAAEMDAAPESLDLYVDQCLGWNIDGLVFIALENDPVWPDVAKALARLPRVVSVMGNLAMPNGSSADIDIEGGVRQAVMRLHGQGRRKIVQILEDVDRQMNRRRWQAFRDVHAELGRPVADDQLCVATKGLYTPDVPKIVEIAKILARASAGRRPRGQRRHGGVPAEGIRPGGDPRTRRHRRCRLGRDGPAPVSQSRRDHGGLSSCRARQGGHRPGGGGDRRPRGAAPVGSRPHGLNRA